MQAPTAASRRSSARKRKDAPHAAGASASDSQRLVSSSLPRAAVAAAGAAPPPLPRTPLAQHTLLGVEPLPAAPAAAASQVDGSTGARANAVSVVAAGALIEARLAEALAHLRLEDPALAPLIDAHGPPDQLLAKSGPAFPTLAKSIVYQQLSTSAASTIYLRVLAACGAAAGGGVEGGEDGPGTIQPLTAGAVLAADPAALRSAGLSARKAEYLACLAQRFADGSLTDEVILGMDDAELQAQLCAVKGIGPWSVHMHSMFHLCRPDVLPLGNLGVRKGMAALYKLKGLPRAYRHRAVPAEGAAKMNFDLDQAWQGLGASALQCNGAIHPGTECTPHGL